MREHRYRARSGHLTVAVRERLRRDLSLGDIAAMFPSTRVQRLWAVETGYMWLADEAHILCGLYGMDAEELFPERRGAARHGRAGHAWLGGEAVDREAARVSAWAEEAAVPDYDAVLDWQAAWARAQRRLSARDAAVVLDYGRGWTLQEIADALGFTREAVRQILRRVGARHGGLLRQALGI